jgi:hypothetical protein
LKRKSKYEAPTSKIVPFRFGTRLTADRPNKTKANAVNSNVITAILKSRKTIDPQISQQPISSIHSNDELFPPIDDVNINNNQSLNSNNNLINLKNNLQKSNINRRKINNEVNTNTKSGLTDVNNINNYLISPKKNHENSNLININLDSEFKNNFGKNKELDLIDSNAKSSFTKPANNQNFTKKEYNNVSLANEKNKGFPRDTKDFIKDHLKSENQKELEGEGKAANKIHFSLNPLANIYKLSNKNCSKENNLKDENFENNVNSVKIVICLYDSEYLKL